MVWHCSSAWWHNQAKKKNKKQGLEQCQLLCKVFPFSPLKRAHYLYSWLRDIRVRISYM